MLFRNASVSVRLPMIPLANSFLGYYFSVAVQSTSAPHPTRQLPLPNVELYILTLVKGDRSVDAPINKPEFYKPLEKTALEQGVRMLKKELEPYAR